MKVKSTGGCDIRATLGTVEFLSERPKSDLITERNRAGRFDAQSVRLRSVDLLSEALRTLPMSGCLIARAELTAPWGLGLHRFGAAVFHVMLEGSAWLDTGAGPRIRLRSGDIAVLMSGESHVLLSDRDASVTSFADLMEHCVPGRFPEIEIRGGGERAAMLCGFFNFDRRTTHPLLRALPDIIHV